MKKLVLLLFLVVSGAAHAKPAHLLYHAAKGVTYPARHPQKVAHGLWKALKVVF